MITVDQLKPGQVYNVKIQGAEGTPITVEATIIWVVAGSVYYTRAGGIIVGSAPVERFLRNVNQQ